MLRHAGRSLLAALALAVAAAWLAISLAPDDPARWHVDPAGIALRATPNEYLAAVAGSTAATPHLLAALHPESPDALLICFDAIVRARPRVAVLAGSVAEGMITYVQRSRLMRFPDYITVKAAQGDGGAGLIIWSRSRYGHSDFGVNRARVTAWLNEADATC